MASQQRTWDLSVMEDADTTVAQLLTPRYTEDLKGRILIEKKDDIRARIGRSPDQADALLLAFAVPVNAQAAYFEAMERKNPVLAALSKAAMDAHQATKPQK